MGVFHWPVRIRALDGATTVPLEALVDTGASYTSVPASLLRRLGVQPTMEREFALADGRRTRLPVAWVIIELDGQAFPTPCVVAAEGSQPLLGAVTLEEAGLAVDPINKRLLPVPGFLA